MYELIWIIKVVSSPIKIKINYQNISNSLIIYIYIYIFKILFIKIENVELKSDLLC